MIIMQTVMFANAIHTEFPAFLKRRNPQLDADAVKAILMRDITIMMDMSVNAITIMKLIKCEI